MLMMLMMRRFKILSAMLQWNSKHWIDSGAKLIQQLGMETGSVSSFLCPTIIKYVPKITECNETKKHWGFCNESQSLEILWYSSKNMPIHIC